MKLIDLVSSIDTLDENSTIYATSPWTVESDAIVAEESADANSSSVFEREGKQYFLEVFIAREFLNDWEVGLDFVPTDEDRCNRLIQYAQNDA